MNPKVSVIMSVYNGAEYLRDAIDSILDQTFSDFEFLIVDDCSNDNSSEILKEYENKDSRFRIISNEFNLGLTKNLNKAIREAKGEYIARFDCDDVSLPERFAEQVKFLDENPKCGVVGLWADIIDATGKHIRTIKYSTSDSELRNVLIVYNPFFHSGVMIRREAFDTVGFYDESWRYAQDYELYFRIAKKFELANIPKVLLKYRETGGSITATKNKAQIMFVLKAKKKAIKEGQYPLWNYVYLLRSYVAYILPVWFKKKLKSF